MSDPKKAWWRARSPQPAKTMTDALYQCLHISLRQAALGAVAVISIATGANLAHAYAWLGLFGLCALPLCACAITLALSQTFFKICWNWRAAWLLLVTSLLAYCWLDTELYARWMQYQNLRGLSPAQGFVSAAVVGLLSLAMPLWKTQTEFTSWQWAQLKQTALTAELKALQAQIEPHFLFNTLANTRYLARHEPAKAVVMLDHLIAYLHTSLPDLRTLMSTLAREFELATHYLELMQLRFGARLHYAIACPPGLRDADLPPLSLMCLVENAIRHGVEPQPSIVRVELCAEYSAQELQISVRDNGAGLSQTVFGHGVGLRNLRERLTALYGEATVELRTLDDGRTEASFIMPLHFSQSHPHA
jgi:hypothetical protein